MLSFWVEFWEVQELFETIRQEQYFTYFHKSCFQENALHMSMFTCKHCGPLFQPRDGWTLTSPFYERSHTTDVMIDDESFPDTACARSAQGSAQVLPNLLR